MVHKKIMKLFNSQLPVDDFLVTVQVLEKKSNVYLKIIVY